MLRVPAHPGIPAHPASRPTPLSRLIRRLGPPGVPGPSGGPVDPGGPTASRGPRRGARCRIVSPSGTISADPPLDRRDPTVRCRSGRRAATRDGRTRESCERRAGEPDGGADAVGD
ncbi:hypothetical protein GCM10023322_77070 [Rugosimonospora acidiphila]|uniref:Uncharacterized protein n=1 Tax=Rugosimonospora acidiphila TaxID=556531 RepID=A0ABP9SQ07_9ACTN